MQVPATVAFFCKIQLLLCFKHYNLTVKGKALTFVLKYM
jgi:hypothetical protein